MKAIIRLLLGLSLIGWFPPGLEASETSEGPVSVLRRFSWSSSSATAKGRGLLIFHATPDGSVTKLFAEAPGGTRVVVSDVINPRSGELHERVRDDSTGWWLEITRDAGIRATTLSEAFKKAREELSPDRTTMPGRLRFRGSDEVEVVVPILPSGKPDCASVAGKVSPDFRRVLLQQVPAQLREPVAFLETALGPERDGVPQYGAELRCSVEFLAALLRQEGLLKPPSAAWSQETTVVGGGRKDAVLKTEEDKFFLSGFKSISDASRPLLGNRVEDSIGTYSPKD